MKVLVVAGARPNFMKVAPVLSALAARRHERVFVHTGQHYDASMSDAFFRDLELPVPDFHLGVGSASHARQTARVMEAFEPVLEETRPHWVVVVGDVNSTLACALVASKMQSGGLCRIAHVEAGLRSNDWGMPEEVNRVLTDRLSDALLIPSRDAEANLHREGITSGISFVGNVMIDSLLRMLPAARASGALERLSLKPRGYLLATLHRPSNVDDAGQLGTILDAFAVLSRELQVLLPLHPRTRDRARAFGFEDRLERLTVTDPLPYIEMLGVQAAAAAILTDSGGVQEESTVLGVPCVTLRESTERPVTVTEGTNQLAPWPLSSAGIVRAAHDALSRGVVAVGSRAPELWDGQSGSRVVEALER